MLNVYQVSITDLRRNQVYSDAGKVRNTWAQAETRLERNEPRLDAIRVSQEVLETFFRGASRAAAVGGNAGFFAPVLGLSG